MAISNSSRTERMSMSVDPDAPITTVLSQPSLYVGLTTLIPFYLAQISPRDWLSAKYVGTKVNGLRTERYLFMPATIVAWGYVYTAMHAMEGNNVHAHCVGLATSFTAGLSAIYVSSKVSYWWLGLGMFYWTFGLIHHRNNLKIYCDQAPWVNWSDAKDIWTDFWRRRKEKKELKQAKKQSRLA